MTRRFWLVAVIALLEACGGDDDNATSPAKTSSPSAATTQAATDPATTSATTTPASTTVPRSETSATTTVVIPTTSTASCSQPPAFDLDRPLREQFVDYLAACGFTHPEAACLFDHLDFENPEVLAGDPDAMVPAFETCRIDVARMTEIASGSHIDGGA